VSRLQGGFFSNIAKVLAEDTADHLRNLAQRIRPRPAPIPRELRVVTARATGMPASRIPERAAPGPMAAATPAAAVEPRAAAAPPA
jgi:hypothetical protein